MRLVIVGEAPGRQEVIEGRAFVGKAGRRLNQALAASGVERTAVYVTNAVLCHPAGNQSPPPRDAIAACHARLIHEVSQRAPQKVLALGTVAAKALTGDSRTIESLRVEPHVPSPFLGTGAEVRVTYHPSALSRNPGWPGRFDGDVGWLAEP
jgi:DNA polymerase